MSGLSIHEKRQLAEQLAREQLSKSGQYRFGIPQSVLNAKANEFMRLSDKEIQQKFNEYFQSTGLNAKPKDLWDSMGLNLEQKKKAEAHMKGLQKQINKKYMRPASSNKKKTGAKQAKNILPNDVKKEIRQFMVALLKQAFNQKSEEFRNYLLNNKGGFAEGAMELHDLGSKFADKLTEIGIVVDRGDTRAEIREKLIKKQAEIDVLESYIGDEKSFNELFQKYFNENFDYQSTFDYICASSEFTTQDSAKKIEKFNKKIDGLTKTNLKSADDYMGNASGAGGLMDLAFNVALMYVSGGSSAIGKYAQMTAKGGTELAENAITKVAGKKLAQSSAGQAMSQGVGIVAAQTTSAGLNAVAFQGTKTAELAGETLATGEIDTEKAKNIVASAEGLFKFGYVGGAISGPLGMQVKGLTTKLLNSKPIINQILTKGITSRPAPLTSVLKDISEHSEAIGEVLKFGTEFGINAGYMAYDEGVSYTDAMKNLAQMDGVSKMVIAMLGGKNLEFLTPKKVQQIKTDLAGYKVNIAIYEGQKVYSVKDAKGKETKLASPEELFMFILDKEAQNVGVKAEHSKADNTPKPDSQTKELQENSNVRADEVKAETTKDNTAEVKEKTAQENASVNVTSQELITTYDNVIQVLQASNSARETVDMNGNKVIIYHKNALNLGDYSFARFDKEGKLVEQGEIAPDNVKETFGKTAEEFSKIKQDGTMMMSLDFGILENIAKTLKLSWDVSKFRSILGNDIKQPTQYDNKLVPIEDSEVASLEAKYDELHKKMPYLFTEEKKNKLIDVAKVDKDVVQALLENPECISNITNIIKSAQIDKDLTIRLIKATCKQSINKRIKGHRKIPLYYHSFMILDIVKASQKDKQIVEELISDTKTRYQASMISSVVEVAIVDKQLAKFLLKNHYFQSRDGYQIFAEALNINKKIAEETLQKYHNKKNGILNYQFVSIVSAKNKYPEIMKRIENELNEHLQNTTDVYNALQDISDILMSYGESYLGKTIDELTLTQKTKLINKLINIKTNYKLNKNIKKYFPFFPDNAGEAYTNTLSYLIKELKTEVVQKSKDEITGFNNDIKKISPDIQKIESFVEKYLPDLNKTTVAKNSKTMLERISKNKEFHNLSENDKKIVLFSTLISNIGGNESPALIGSIKAKEFGFSNKDVNKVYQIVKNADLIANFMETTREEFHHNYEENFHITDRQVKFDRFAFDLKEGNTFNLAKIVYSSKDVERLTRFLDKKIAARIQEMKADDFVLPQTSDETYHKLSHKETVKRGDKEYHVKVVNAEDIPDFFAYVHSAVGLSGMKGDMSNQNKVLKLGITNQVQSERIICTSYISNDNICTQGVSHIFEVPNESQYVASGHDIGSVSKNINQMLTEYYYDNNIEARTHSNAEKPEYKIEERKMVACNIKEILGISNNEYIKRIDNLKEKLGDRTCSLELMENIDPELANAYKTFLSRKNIGHKVGDKALMNNSHVEWNECLVSHGKRIGFATPNLSRLDEAELQQVVDDNLVIVVLSKN